MRFTPEQIDRLAQVPEVYIWLPEKYLKKAPLMSRYHLMRGSISGDNGKSELFYNADLRSHCGMWGNPSGWDDGWELEGGADILIFPRYYAQGWRSDHWFSNLLRDATQVRVSKPSGWSQSRVRGPRTLDAALRRIGGI